MWIWMWKHRKAWRQLKEFWENRVFLWHVLLMVKDIPVPMADTVMSARQIVEVDNIFQTFLKQASRGDVS